MANLPVSATSGAPDAESAVKILLSEKEYADQQITGNFASNIRIVGTIFTIVVSVLGWVFATDPPLQPHQVALVLLSLVALGSVGLIMAALTNGFAFGFIAYKSGFLGPRLARLAGLTYNPLWATSFINTTPARKLIFFATSFLAIAQLALSFGVFIAGTVLLLQQVSAKVAPRALLWFIPVAGLMLVGATVAAILVVTTVTKLRQTYSGTEGSVA
ncbi:MAG: hypothetical protein QOH06_1629 [Acidobacteriota bacterium]|jgi:hypothetical protein|nr:hypothetical protein [Acidobacteriota bacterium]